MKGLSFVSKSKVKDLRKTLAGALAAQQVIVRKARGLVAVRQLFNESVDELIGQIDIVGRRLQALSKELAEAEKPPKKKKKKGKKAADAAEEPVPVEADKEPE